MKITKILFKLAPRFLKHKLFNINYIIFYKIYKIMFAVSNCCFNFQTVKKIIKKFQGYFDGGNSKKN